MPRPRGLPKTGGRKRGVPNRPKPEILPPGSPEAIYKAEVARAVVIGRTPKAVMLDAMVRFANLSETLFCKAERMAKTRANPEKIAILRNEAHKFMIAAVQCAEKVAPYIHARLLAVESRGDNVDPIPFVLRAPSVVENSARWQAMVAAEVIEQEADQPARVAEWLEHVAREAPRTASVAQPAALADPRPSAAPDPAQAAKPVALVADQNTGRISTTMMPVGPVVVRPSGSAEWLAAVTEDRRKAAG